MSRQITTVRRNPVMFMLVTIDTTVRSVCRGRRRNGVSSLVTRPYLLASPGAPARVRRTAAGPHDRASAVRAGTNISPRGIDGPPPSGGTPDPPRGWIRRIRRSSGADEQGLGGCADRAGPVPQPRQGEADAVGADGGGRVEAVPLPLWRPVQVDAQLGVDEGPARRVERGADAAAGVHDGEQPLQRRRPLAGDHRGPLPPPDHRRAGGEAALGEAPLDRADVPAVPARRRLGRLG